MALRGERPSSGSSAKVAWREGEPMRSSLASRVVVGSNEVGAVEGEDSEDAGVVSRLVSGSVGSMTLISTRASATSEEGSGSAIFTFFLLLFATLAGCFLLAAVLGPEPEASSSLPVLELGASRFLPVARAAAFLVCLTAGPCLNLDHGGRVSVPEASHCLLWRIQRSM